MSTETAKPEIRFIAPGDAERLGNAETDDVPAILRELGVKATETVGITLDPDMRPYYIDLTPDDAGTRIITPAEAPDKSNFHNTALGLPPAEEAYNAFQTQENAAIDQASQVRSDAERNRQQDREQLVGAYKAALDKMSEALGVELLEPEARTRAELEVHIQDLRQQVNRAHLHGGSVHFEDNIDLLKATLARRDTIFDQARSPLGVFAKTTDALIAGIDTEDETNAQVSGNLSRTSDEYRGSSERALAELRSENIRYYDYISQLEQALDQSDSDAVNRLLTDIERTLHENPGLRAGEIKNSLEQSSSSLRSLRQWLEGDLDGSF